MLQPWKANSVFPLHTTWDVSPDCSKVTPSTQTLPSLVGAHNNTLPKSSPPSHPPILSLHYFCLFSCLSGAVTGSSSFAPLISPDLTSASIHHCLLSPSAVDCLWAQSFYCYCGLLLIH